MTMEEMTVDFADVMAAATWTVAEAIGDHYEDFGEELTYHFGEHTQTALNVLGNFNRAHLAEAKADEEAHKADVYAAVMIEAAKGYAAINLQKEAAEIVLSETRRNGYKFDQETFCTIEGKLAETVEALTIHHGEYMPEEVQEDDEETGTMTTAAVQDFLECEAKISAALREAKDTAELLLIDIQRSYQQADDDGNEDCAKELGRLIAPVFKICRALSDADIR